MTDEIKSIPIANITISPNRFRKEMGDIEELAQSILEVGLLVPIAVNVDMTLIAGERRIRAHERLGIPEIKAIIQSRSETQQRILEIVENIHRKAFNWREEALAIEALHQMLVAESGKDWTQDKTADKAGYDKGKISRDLGLAKAIQNHPEIFEGVKDQKTAYKRLKKFELDNALAELALRKSKTNYGIKANEMVWQGDCLDLIEKIPDKSVDAIISDPFYGLDISKVKKLDDKQHIYHDDIDLYTSTMTNIIMKSLRVVKDDSWIVLFCAIENFQFLYDTLSAVGWNCDHMPGFWYRGPVGQTNDPNHRLARCYETFVYGYRGDAMLKTPGKSLVLQHSGVHPGEKIHEVQKPLSLMEELVTMFCLPGSTILDFMCGSGTTICAGIKRGCKVYGFELDVQRHLVAINRVSAALKLKSGGKADEIR